MKIKKQLELEVEEQELLERVYDLLLRIEDNIPTSVLVKDDLKIDIGKLIKDYDSLMVILEDPLELETY